MGSNNDGWTDKALFAVAGDPHSTLAELAVRPYQDKLNRDTQFSDSRTTIKVGAVLTASERTYLQEEVYPYLNLIFQSNVSSSHGLAYTRRLIEQELVVKKCIASERVCDIGGNWALNLRMGRVNIHSCCPSLDARDQQRQVTRENETKRWLCTVHEQYNVCKNISVDKKLARKYRNAKLFEEDPKSIFCSLPAEDCNYAADTVLFNDSFYDMNLDVIGNILDTKDARIGYGNITFSPEMLYANKGYIRGMNCSWERIKSKLLVEGKIVMREQLKYSFNNCYGLTYKHDYRNMILLATRQQVVTRAGRVYVIERSYSNGIMRLVLTRVFGTNYSSELSFNIWREEVRGKVLVRLYNYKGVSNSNRHNNITCTEALVDEDLYEGVLSYALRLDGDKFTEENIFSYCVSKNARMTINGVDVTVSKSESVKTAYKLAFTVWFQAFMIKYEKTMIHGHFYNKEMNNRGIRDASWPKILSMLLTNSISPGLYKKFYGPGGNVFENLAGNIKDNLAAVNESYDDLKNPDSMLPEPCISLTEHIDTLENDFIATEYPYDEFKKLSEEFDGKRGSDDIKTLLDKLSGKLRTGSIEPHTRELLTEEFRHLLLKLVNHDEVKQEDPNKPWSVRENVNRLMDNLIDPEELPKDLAKPMSTVDITVFGSDSVESFEGTKKVFEPEVSSALNERRTNHDDKCFITDRTEELKPSDSISNGNGLGVTILYNETLEIGYLIERFGVTFDLINVSGEGGLCAVIAVTKALEECGIITSEKDVYDSLVRASDGSRTSWFTLADIAVLCDSYSIGCVLLRNSLNEPLEEAKLRIDRYKFNTSDKNIVIYHSNNHWQYIAKGITYRWMFDKETFNVKEKSPSNDFESPENRSEVDEEEDPLVAMGIDSEDLNCDVLGGGKCQKYVKFLRRKPEVFDPEKVQLLHENEEINYGSNEDNGNSDDTHKTVVDVHSPCEIFVKGLTKAFDSSSGFCSKIQNKVRNDNGYGAKLLKITSFDFKIHNKIVSEFRRSDEFRTKIFFGFIIAWMTLFAGLLHTITSFTLIGFCSQIIALIVIKILFQNFLIGFLIKTTRWFLSNMGTFGEYLALVTFVILVHLTYKCYKFSFMNSSKIHERMSDESIVVAEENVTEARQDKTVNSVFGNKPYNTEYKNRKPYSASTVLNEVDEIRVLQKEEYDKVEEVLEKTLLTRPVANKDKKPTKIQIAGESSSNYREEGEKAGYNTLSKTDRERTLIDRTALVKSYVDYLKTSVTNYLAHCDFVWSQRKKFGEKFFSAQYRRDKSTLHAHVLETTKPGVFKLPQLYTRDENHSITLAYVPGTNGKGKLCRAAVKDDNLIVDEDPVCVMIFFGMLEYLDFLTLNSLLNERNINSIEPTRKIKLIDGVPGCAKSTEIANSLREGEMVAVASRAANFELHEKLIARNKNPAASRTIGSRIIGRRETCDRLYVDEGLKVHPGELLVLAEICCCKELIIFGDSKQNRFKPRVPGYSMPENPMHWSVELRTESKTMTKDAVVAVGRLSPTGTGPNCDGEGYYPHGITTISKIEKSMNVIEISAQGEIPKVPNAKYLTFTQEDKHKLLNHGFKNANTIDEFQGGRSKHVILVRLSKNMDVNLRNSSEQFIVAVSRHTERLDYCTVEQPSTLQDLVYRSIMRVNAISNLNAAYGNFSGDKTAKGVITSEAIDFSLKGGGIAPGLTNSVPVTTINCCLEELIPGCTTTEMTYDNTMIELSNINVACEGSLRIPVDRIPAVLKPRKTLKSKIHSSMPPPRQTTFRQCLFSLIKRNMGGAYVGSPMDYRNFARNALESMFDTFAVENWRSIVSTWDKIVPNEEDMLAWERIQNPSTHSAMNRVDPNMAMTDVINHVDDYQFILKPMPKAATDVKPLKVYPTVQTVMYHDKTVNSFFGPIIRRADVRFRSILRTNILYNKGRSIDNIENFLDEHYVRSGGCITIENDFSDYDRSQKEVAHCLDEVLLEILGLTGEDIALWMRGHNVNTNYNFQLGLRVNLLYQRKSGDVTTAFGNTVLNMVALSYGLKLRRDEVFSAMFLGDDSWLQLKKSPSLRLRTLECSERIAVHFNGEAKTAIFKVGYFCGNYIIETDEKILLMADPVKRAVKLGRWDVKEASVLHENWISFKDLMRNYDNEAAQECLALAVLERTPKATFGTVKILIESLNSLSKSFKEFRNCYDKEVTITHY